MQSARPFSNSVGVNGIRFHYLDWGGDGPPLVFLAGMGCSAYIFGRIAPRFSTRFRVLSFDRRGHGDSDYPESGYDPDTLADDLRQFLDQLSIERTILVGHSMACIELSRLAVLHPKRVLALVFLDAAYDASQADYKAAYQKNPLGKMIPPWPEEDPASVEEYVALLKRLYPALAVIWNDTMVEQTQHTIAKAADGRVRDKMTVSISKAINDVFASYSPEFSKIQAPVLSFFSIRDGSDYLSSEYMSEEQKAEVRRYFASVLKPLQREQIEVFKRHLPHAKVVEIDKGHHYCFIKDEETVVQEMMSFLLQHHLTTAVSGDT